MTDDSAPANVPAVTYDRCTDCGAHLADPHAPGCPGTRMNLRDIIRTAETALTVPVNTQRTGDTVTLWAETPGCVIVVGTPAGPWRPDEFGNVTVDDGFWIEVSLGNRDNYFSGAEPDLTLEGVETPTLADLALVIAYALEQSEGLYS